MYKERIGLGAALILSFALIEFIVFGGLGIAVPLVVVIFYTLVLNLRKGKLEKRAVIRWGIPVLLVTLCFALFDNNLLKVFNLLLLFSLMIIHISEIYKLNPYEPYTVKWLLGNARQGIMRPFAKFNNALEDAKKESEQMPESRGQLIKKVVIGVVISIPVLFIAGFLLMSADAAFEGVVNVVLNKFEIDLFYFVTRIVGVSLLFIPCTGYFKSLEQPINKGRDQVEAGDQGWEEGYDGAKVQWKLDFTIGITACTLLVGLYLVYCMAQMGYFISAFGGILPSDFTYAEYARRGFFEMLPIALLNIGIIAGLNLLVEGKEETKKNRWIKGYSVFFIGFTIFIISTALAKMMMYMSEYGLTIKRVYVTWFLILSLASIVLIGVSLFKTNFKLIKKLMLTFIALYIGLNYCNVDYLIGKYNAHLYQTKGAQVEESFWDLSLSGVGPLMEMKSEYYGGYMEHYKWQLDCKSGWESWNLAKYHASQLIRQDWQAKNKPLILGGQ